MRDYRRFPAWVEVLKELGSGEGGSDSVHGGILLCLVVDIFAVADLVRLIPVPPRGRGYVIALRKRFGENFFLVTYLNLQFMSRDRSYHCERSSFGIVCPPFAVRVPEMAGDGRRAGRHLRSPGLGLSQRCLTCVECRFWSIETCESTTQDSSVFSRALCVRFCFQDGLLCDGPQQQSYWSRSMVHCPLHDGGVSDSSRSSSTKCCSGTIYDGIWALMRRKKKNCNDNECHQCRDTTQSTTQSQGQVTCSAFDSVKSHPRLIGLDGRKQVLEKTHAARRGITQRYVAT